MYVDRMVEALKAVAGIDGRVYWLAVPETVNNWPCVAWKRIASEDDDGMRSELKRPRVMLILVGRRNETYCELETVRLAMNQTLLDKSLLTGRPSVAIDELLEPLNHPGMIWDVVLRGD